MEFINTLNLINVKYDTYPFPHTIIDNFINTDKVKDILLNINNLDDNKADAKFIDNNSPYEYNKYAFNKNYGETLKKLFIELNSVEFISILEKITGITNLITNDIELQGAGIHRIKNGGYLKLHTDFNSYYKFGVKLDRRINLLIYMNPDWKPEYNGSLCLCDKDKNICVKQILPILNRCVIFNTSSKSVHGHPIPLSVPNNIKRQSIAVYYYIKIEQILKVVLNILQYGIRK